MYFLWTERKCDEKESKTSCGFKRHYSNGCHRDIFTEAKIFLCELKNWIKSACLKARLCKTPDAEKD